MVICDNYSGAPLVNHDVGGAVVLPLQVFSNTSERLHSLPTGSNGTSTAHAMTLTGEFHKLLDSL